MAKLRLADWRNDGAKPRIRGRRRGGADQCQAAHDAKFPHPTLLSSVALPGALIALSERNCALQPRRYGLSGCVRGAYHALIRIRLLLLGSSVLALGDERRRSGHSADPDRSTERRRDHPALQHVTSREARRCAMRWKQRRVRPPSERRWLHYDRLNELLGDASGEATIYREVSPTAAAARPAENARVRMSSEGTKLAVAARSTSGSRRSSRRPTRRPNCT